MLVEEIEKIKIEFNKDAAAVNSPDELEKSPVPTQERARLDNVQGLRPCGVEAGKEKHDYTIAVLDLRMIYGAAKHDELLAQQGVLCDKLWSRPHQVPGGARHQDRHE